MTWVTDRRSASPTCTPMSCWRSVLILMAPEGTCCRAPFALPRTLRRLRTPARGACRTTDSRRPGPSDRRGASGRRSGGRSWRRPPCGLPPPTATRPRNLRRRPPRGRRGPAGRRGSSSCRRPANSEREYTAGATPASAGRRAAKKRPPGCVTRGAVTVRHSMGSDPNRPTASASRRQVPGSPAAASCRAPRARGCGSATRTRRPGCRRPRVADCPGW